MNTEIKYKFLNHLNSKKANKGFTLIELLVVVIIIGVLAAIALPNLLNQIAKGRQAEAKNNLGAMNRTQQAYRLEELTFATTLDDLPVKLSWQYYNQPVFDSTAKSNATYNTKALDQFEDDILDYGAGVMQNKSGNYVQVICEEKSLNSNGNAAPIFVQVSTSGGDTNSVNCDTSKSKEIKK